MTPERELLLEQATACRQLALIADTGAADRLKALATEYETLAFVDNDLLHRRELRTPPRAASGGFAASED